MELNDTNGVLIGQLLFEVDVLQLEPFVDLRTSRLVAFAFWHCESLADQLKFLLKRGKGLEIASDYIFRTALVQDLDEGLEIPELDDGPRHLEASVLCRVRRAHLLVRLDCCKLQSGRRK